MIEFRRPIAEGQAQHAIRDALAILDAIGHGELFEAVPESDCERQRHMTGLALLELLQSRLRQALGNGTT